MKISNKMFLTESEGGISVQMDIAEGIKFFEQALKGWKSVVSELFDNTELNDVVCAMGNIFGNVIAPSPSWEREFAEKRALGYRPSVNIASIAYTAMLTDLLLGENEVYDNSVNMVCSFIGSIDPHVVARADLTAPVDEPQYRFTLDLSPESTQTLFLEGTADRILEACRKSFDEASKIRISDIVNASPEARTTMSDTLVKAIAANTLVMRLPISFYKVSEYDGIHC